MLQWSTITSPSSLFPEITPFSTVAASWKEFSDSWLTSKYKALQWTKMFQIQVWYMILAILWVNRRGFNYFIGSDDKKHNKFGLLWSSLDSPLYIFLIYTSDLEFINKAKY